jgi:hypothetical protein
MLWIDWLSGFAIPAPLASAASVLVIQLWQTRLNGVQVTAFVNTLVFFVFMCNVTNT